jgi:HSP20 family molecular chaperone IbpA
MRRVDPATAARAIEVIESPEAVTIRHDGEGDDVDVRFSEREVTVHAPSEAEHTEGEVVRRLPLSAPLDMTAARATVRDGVLELRIPKRSAER